MRAAASVSGDVMQMRGISVRAIVHASADTGQVQTVDASAHTDMVRGEIEVAQPFGFASLAPAGGFTVLLAMGGDEGDMIALPVMHPAYRFGGLAPGESVMYGADGARVAIRNGGTIEIRSGAAVTITAPAVTIAAEVAIQGDLVVSGSITSGGDVADAHGPLSRLRARYDGHVHGSSPGTSQPD